MTVTRGEEVAEYVLDTYDIDDLIEAIVKIDEAIASWGFTEELLNELFARIRSIADEDSVLDEAGRYPNVALVCSVDESVKQPHIYVVEELIEDIQTVLNAYLLGIDDKES